MKQKTLIAFTYALASVAIFSASPALASGSCSQFSNNPNCNSNQTVPEPGTILGTMLIGGAMAAKKISDRKKAIK